MQKKMAGNGPLSVPPGFRFHPTDEELLYYYLRKKVSYEAIDLDVIREVDLNKLEPWDLKEKCRIGSGPQNEWYFFSHKDKKYPTGTRTNRATAAGFWKATGRDKAIHLSNSSCRRIGMRKTLVFYTGRAPHGQKTDWIMHEYRLDDQNDADHIQEDGWVVCRVFKKKNHVRGFQADLIAAGDDHRDLDLDHQQHYSSGHHFKSSRSNAPHAPPDPSNMHLPQLLSPESAALQPPNSYFLPMGASCISSAAAADDHQHDPSSSSSHHHNHLLMRSLASTASADYNHHHHLVPPDKLAAGDSTWSFLEKLLASTSSSSTHRMDHQQSKSPNYFHPLPVHDALPSLHNLSYQYHLSYDQPSTTDHQAFKFPK